MDTLMNDAYAPSTDWALLFSWAVWLYSGFSSLGSSPRLTTIPCHHATMP